MLRAPEHVVDGTNKDCSKGRTQVMMNDFVASNTIISKDSSQVLTVSTTGKSPRSMPEFLSKSSAAGDSEYRIHAVLSASLLLPTASLVKATAISSSFGILHKEFAYDLQDSKVSFDLLISSGSPYSGIKSNSASPGQCIKVKEVL